MQIPPADEIRKMRGREVLALGSDWFKHEGRRAVDFAAAATESYGADKVGPEMHLRASMFFAMATMIDVARVKAEAKDARREDGVFASLLANTLRSGLIPIPPKAEASKDAA